MAAVIGLFFLVDFRTVFGLLNQVKKQYVLLIVLVFPLTLVISTLRLRLFIKQPSEFQKLLRITWIGSVSGLLLPSYYAGDLVKLAYLPTSTSLPQKIRSLLLDRFAGFCALYFMGVAAFLVKASALAEQFDITLIISILIGLGLLLFVFPLLVAYLPVTTQIGDVAKFLTRLWKDTHWWQALFFSEINLLISVICMYLAFAGLSHSISLLPLMIIVPILQLFSAIPLPLGGIGVTEVLALVLFSPLGVTPEVVVTVFFLLRSIQASILVTGLLLIEMSRIFYSRFEPPLG